MYIHIHIICERIWFAVFVYIEQMPLLFVCNLCFLSLDVKCELAAHVRMYIILYIYSRTWIVSTLKSRQNRYSLSEVLTIRGAFMHEVGTEQ